MSLSPEHPRPRAVKANATEVNASKASAAQGIAAQEIASKTGSTRRCAMSSTAPKQAEQEFQSVKRVAQQLDISTKRVYQMIAEKKLEAMRVSRRQIRVRAASVRAFIRRALEEFEPGEPC